MSRNSLGVRMAVLMAGAAVLLFWVSHHTEATSADGLRYVREAQRIAQGDFTGGLLHAIDHPAHSLAIAAVHAVFQGDDPFAWQTAAQVASTIALVLTVIPLVLLSREFFDDDATSWLACVLLFANPIIGLIAVNVLSESTFLLFWTWGLWAAARFLREGRFTWLPLTIGFGALAYLTRPEGLLLHLTLVATLLFLPLRRITRIYWPRWWAAVGLLVLGPAILVGPYIATRGGLGTKPAVARVLGTMPRSPAEALERERPLPLGQTVPQAYGGAAVHVLSAFSGALTWPLIPLAVLGLIVARPSPERTRLWLFASILLIASFVGLVRLEVTAGYCAPRHALIPSILLVIAAAHGLSWLIEHLAIDGRVIGLGPGRLRPGPAVWALVVILIAGWPLLRARASYQSSYLGYRMAGAFLAQQPGVDGQVLDLTDWTLFFSGRSGHGFEAVVNAPALYTRWLVVSDRQLANPENRAAVVARRMVDGREPIARFPDPDEGARTRVLVFDLTSPRTIAHGPTDLVNPTDESSRLR